MYRIGICDDDKILCSALEEQIYELSKELAIKIEIDVWYSGESIENDLKKGIELDLLFLDIELVQNNGIAVGNFIRNELEDMQTHIVYISSKESYAMQLFKVQPLDFLIKPVPVEQIKEVLIRSIKQKRSADTYFEYQKGNSVFRVPIKDIAYFMSMDKKIVIVKNRIISPPRSLIHPASRILATPTRLYWQTASRVLRESRATMSVSRPVPMSTVRKSS